MDAKIIEIPLLENWLQSGTSSQLKSYIAYIIFQSLSVINSTLVEEEWKENFVAHFESNENPLL